MGVHLPIRRNMGLIPGLGRSHTPRSNQVSQLLTLGTLEAMLHHQRSRHGKKPGHRNWRKPTHGSEDSTVRNKQIKLKKKKDASGKLMGLWYSHHQLSTAKHSSWGVCPCSNTVSTPEDVEMMSGWRRLCLPHCPDLMSRGTVYLGSVSQGHHCVWHQPTNCCFLGDLMVSAHSEGLSESHPGFP